MNTLLTSKLQNCTVTRFNTFHIRALSTSQLKEYSSLLNVNKTSSPKEIKESFLKLSKIYHPDNSVSGSHIKFVKLKEAYDALKDGVPATTTSTYNNAGQASARNSYSNYNEHADLSYKAHAYYRNQSRDNYTNFRERPFSQGFGGRYANSKTPWEDLMRDREWDRWRDNEYRGRYQPYKRTLMHTTLFLGAIAWIVIYSSVSLIWEYNDNIRSSMAGFKGNYDEYAAFEEAMRRKEHHKLFRSKMVKGQKKNQEEEEKVADNNQKVGEPQDAKTDVYATNAKVQEPKVDRHEEFVLSGSLDETLLPFETVEVPKF